MYVLYTVHVWSCMSLHSLQTASAGDLVLESGSLGITDWVWVPKNYMYLYLVFMSCGVVWCGMHFFFPQQVDQLLVARMLESVSTATTSLVSLVQLLDKVKNMIISDLIQQEVRGAMISSESAVILWCSLMLCVKQWTRLSLCSSSLFNISVHHLSSISLFTVSV